MIRDSMLKAIQCAFFVVWLWPSLGEAVKPGNPSNPSKFLMGISENDLKTTSGVLVTKIYPEALRRLGIQVEITPVPLSRLTLMVENGEIDGEVSRVAEYAKDHPRLVRVEESITELSFSVYGTKSEPSATKSLKAMAQKKFKIAYRRGVGVCEKAIQAVFPPQQFEDLNFTEQGLKQLQTGRLDYFCDITETVEFFLKLPEYDRKPKIQKAFDVGDSIETYPYFNAKHKSLAPQLAAVLRDMKKEGLYERYLREARSELLATHLK